jgi:hypothetical protein
MGSEKYWHTATLLPSGKVLIAGGIDETGYTASAELYDPVTGTFTFTNALRTERGDHIATLMASGQVLFEAGESKGGRLPEPEFYNPNQYTVVADNSKPTNAEMTMQ